MLCKLLTIGLRTGPGLWFLSQPPQPSNYSQRKYALTVYVIHLLANHRTHNTVYIFAHWGYFDSHIICHNATSATSFEKNIPPCETGPTSEDPNA